MGLGEALLVGALIALVVSACVMTVTALIGRAQGRVAVVDIAWGLDVVLIALAAGLVAYCDDRADWRTWTVVAAVAIWGLRLSVHLYRRDRGDEDPRYENLLGGTVGEVGMAVAVRKVFGIQAVAAALVALPVAAGLQLPGRWTWAVIVGLMMWAVGVFFEAVGDAQLAEYRSTPRDQRPLVLDTGLWRYTRHPNYFGDAAVAWGLWLAAGLSVGWQMGAATVIAPIAMTYFLVHATGAGLLERTMMQRPGYPEYAARTSGFIPRPPKR